MRNLSIALCTILVASCSNNEGYNENVLSKNYNLKTPPFTNIKKTAHPPLRTIEELGVLTKQAEAEALNTGREDDLKKYRVIYKELALAISQKPRIKVVVDDYSKAISAVLNLESNKIINRSPKRSRILFGHNSSYIKSDANSVIDINAMFLKATPEARVMLAGFADLKGDPEYNLWLGKRRAASVAEALVSLGVNPEQISVVSYGESYSSNVAISEFDIDRRVDFVY
ncbi:OmpA family protein [Shewanella sp. SG44-6]|uniref:OmpA family protein n=1 Tax=Shewanella sp. SG44-6 TaxID=2760959 RepID=UPI0016012791|nr:OmpA family protein [Shewanella sp. SG44-6]MBB1388754.1 OmpA family protein [Shewanella sp. SG44-6]